MKNKRIKIKIRNLFAIAAHFRKKGIHTDQKKKENKDRCRKEIDLDKE